MKLSIYTFIKDGIYYDFHTVAMLKHHLPLADEIIVNEGYSTDGTYEAIRDLDPKIEIFRERWDRSDPKTWHVKFKNRAREKCTGDWCILLDSDEFIPEWEFDRLRECLEQTEYDILPIRYKHFYANYKVYQSVLGKTPELNLRIHRNLPEVVVWGDGANVRTEWDTIDKYRQAPAFDCHHFGEVRDPARLRQKWRTQARQHDEKNARWDRVPGKIFDLLPHKWDDPDLLPRMDVYEGPYIQAVREDPDEFVRDEFQIYELLKKQRSGQPASSE